MSHRSQRTLCSLLLALTVFCFPLAGEQTREIDLTAEFVDCGADIDELLVLRVGGVVLIRGTTDDGAKAASAGQIATLLGYDRVANLIRVVDAPAADALIVRRGKRALDLERMLHGCNFQLSSSRGVVSLRGKVKEQRQRALAVEILLQVPGVNKVIWK